VALLAEATLALPHRAQAIRQVDVGEDIVGIEF
jgi:hypothetical protein